MISTSIPFEFLKRLYTMPSWSEIAYGFEHHLIPSRLVIDYAMDRIAATAEPNDDELSIASSSINDPILDRVRKLASQEVASDEDACRLRWANIVLAWAYEHRDQLHNLLDVVQEIYADFNYPQEFAAFVRYMPSDAPDRGTVEANEERMIVSIAEYVKKFIACSTT